MAAHHSCHAGWVPRVGELTNRRKRAILRTVESPFGTIEQAVRPRLAWVGGQGRGENGPRVDVWWSVSLTLPRKPVSFDHAGQPEYVIGAERGPASVPVFRPQTPGGA